MNTSSLTDNGRSRSLARCASLLATFVAALTLASIQPVFAQSYRNSALKLSTGDWGSGEVIPPSFDGPWAYATPSFTGPALAPAPEDPAAPQPAPTFGGFTSEPPAGPWMQPPESPFSQPWVNPSISATNPMRELPPVGLSPGGFGRPIR
jgi:hypothetical protein